MMQGVALPTRSLLRWMATCAACARACPSPEVEPTRQTSRQVMHAGDHQMTKHLSHFGALLDCWNGPVLPVLSNPDFGSFRRAGINLSRPQAVAQCRCDGDRDILRRVGFHFDLKNASVSGLSPGAWFPSCPMAPVPRSSVCSRHCR